MANSTELLKQSNLKLAELVLAQEVALRIEETVAGSVTTTYIGKANPSTLESASFWSLLKIVVTVAGSVTTTVISFPLDGASYPSIKKEFKWDDRAIYTYS